MHSSSSDKHHLHHHDHLQYQHPYHCQHKLQQTACCCQDHHRSQCRSTRCQHSRSPLQKRGCVINYTLLTLIVMLQWSPTGGASCPLTCSCNDLVMYCDKMKLNVVPQGIPRTITRLKLSDNAISILYTGDFPVMPNLKTLLLSGNKIFYIKPKTFSNLTNLEAMSLANNKLSFLTRGTFTGLEKLITLSLHNNRLKDIQTVLEDLTNIRNLNLGNNNVNKITKTTFQANPFVQVIDLHNNGITNIHPKAFRYLPHLRYLILRNNPLYKVRMSFLPNQHLKIMDFTNCSLTSMVKHLPSSIHDLRLANNNITVLNRGDLKSTRFIRLLILNKNQISRIHHQALHPLLHLYNLWMRDNQLRAVPKNLPRGLRGIYLDNNKILRINNGIFNNTPYLEFLSVENNKIIRIKANAFNGLKRLRLLDLSDNAIKYIKSNTFKNLTKLELLDLSRNPLRLAKTSFKGLDHLRILQMQSVSAKSNVKPETFGSMKNLLFLNLRNSTRLVKHLTRSEAILDSLKSIEDLNFNHNQLTNLPSHFPYHFPKLKVVKLVSNPWHCDKNILWLRNWMRNNTVKFLHMSHLKCASPPELSNRLIYYLSDGDVGLRKLPFIDINVQKQLTHKEKLMLENLTYREKFESQSIKSERSRSARYYDSSGEVTSGEVTSGEVNN